MSNLAVIKEYIPAMTDEAIAKVYELEAITEKMPQVDIKTMHTLHGGVYSRTILIPADTLLTGALIKIPTTLIVSGDVIVYIGDNAMPLTGYHVLPASAGRKQAFYARQDTFLTMIFKTAAKIIEDAEAEFTDESHLLLSRINIASNKVVITGE